MGSRGSPHPWVLRSPSVQHRVVREGSWDGAGPSPRAHPVLTLGWGSKAEWVPGLERVPGVFGSRWCHGPSLSSAWSLASVRARRHLSSLRRDSGQSFENTRSRKRHRETPTDGSPGGGQRGSRPSSVVPRHPGRAAMPGSGTPGRNAGFCCLLQAGQGWRKAGFPCLASWLPSPGCGALLEADGSRRWEPSRAPLPWSSGCRAQRWPSQHGPKPRTCPAARLWLRLASSPRIPAPCAVNGPGFGGLACSSPSSASEVADGTSPVQTPRCVLGAPSRLIPSPSLVLARQPWRRAAPLAACPEHLPPRRCPGLGGFRPRAG